jgi:hypothetical protein
MTLYVKASCRVTLAGGKKTIKNSALQMCAA